MKLFLDRNKTLLPRVDSIYLLTRVLAFIGIAGYAIMGNYTQPDSLLIPVILTPVFHSTSKNPSVFCHGHPLSSGGVRRCNCSPEPQIVNNQPGRDDLCQH